MSNKTQLQNNNTKYASLIEALKDKAVPTGGEDVTEETSAYTTKVSELETAVAALESELEGKASGGSGSVTIANVEVIATGPTTFYYIGADGLHSINGVRKNVEIAVPSICYAETISNAYFLAINAAEGCTIISSIHSVTTHVAFAVTGAGSIIIPSQQMEGG